MVWLLIFVFGLCAGSFINCLVYRLHLRVAIRSVLGGRSYCDHCKHQLAWRDNIPLLSFLFLGGQCRYCHSPIPRQYPVVELVTGILTLLIFNFQFQIFNQFLIFNLFITYALIAIFVSDLNYQTIPDEIVYPAIGLAIIFHLHLRGVLLTGLVAAGLFLLLVLITRGKGMGMGDVKLAGLMGLILGFPKIIVALYLAFLTGALVGVILVLIGKKKLGSRIPFGPFLTGATLIVLFWGEEITIKILRLLGQ